MDMKERLQELAENARKRIEESEGLDKLNDVRVAYLGLRFYAVHPPLQFG